MRQRISPLDHDERHGLPRQHDRQRRRPSVTEIVAGAPARVASWLAASSVLYWAGVGAAGEPSFCHAV